MSAATTEPFGDALREARLAAGLTQETLAERAGVSARNIQSLEAGLNRPQRDTAQRLTTALELEGSARAAFLGKTLPRPRTPAPSAQTGQRIPLRAAQPLAATPLLGREREVAAVEALLGTDTRLLTLTGPGGVGKTRLARQVADHLHATWTDGAAFVDLAPLRDPTLVPAAIAQALGIGDAGDQPLLETVRQYLAPRRLLLILDNFEQVVAAAPILADLLGMCPGLSCLVTSREPLRLSWERELSVPPLALPPTEGQDVVAIGQSPAVALFMQRARAVRPDFALTAGNAAAVAALCIQLDGLPLAIELAAARIKLLAPAAILNRLGQRLALLIGGPRDAPLRHQTLRAALDWSYELLEAPDRALFRRLAVCAGGFTLDTAQAVCADATLDRVAALVDRHLVVAETQPDGEPRFRLLETMRAYGLEQLAASGELDQTQEQHAGYFLTLTEQAEPRLIESSQTQWLDRMEVELDNLRAALAWAETAPERLEVGLRLLTALTYFWLIRGHFGEGRTWLERLLAQAERAAVAEAWRAKAWVTIGCLALVQGDYAAAARYLAAMVLHRRALPTEDVAIALTFRGAAAYSQGDYPAARAFVEEGLALARRSNDGWTVRFALGFLARLAYGQGAYAEARRLGQLALQAHKDTWGSAYMRDLLGAVARQMGDYALARSLHEESLALSREVGDRALSAQILTHLGHLERALGDDAAARVRYEESLRICREVGDRRATALALGALGMVAERQGDGPSARLLYEESLSVVRAMGDQRGLPVVLGRLARLAAAQGDRTAARTGYLECLRLWQQVGERRATARCLMDCANLLAKEQPEPALRLYAAADTLLQQMGAPLPSLERAAVDHAMSALRRRLSDGPATAAANAGQAMDLPAAVVQAMESLTALPPDATLFYTGVVVNEQ